MAYVESHQALARHPKTLRLARRLGTSKLETIGLLHMLWWWCLDYAPDGDLTAFGHDEIAMAIDFDGDADALIDALVDAKWIDSDADGLHVHDWSDYGGKLLSRKKANADRMKEARAQDKDASESNVQDTCDARASDVLGQRREEKKRQEEKKGETPPNPLTGDGDGEKPTEKQSIHEQRFERWWAVYPNKTAKQTAFRSWLKIRPDETRTNAFIAAVERQKTGDKWQRGYVQNPATWLNGGCWDDVVAAASDSLITNDAVAAEAARQLQERERLRHSNAIEATGVVR